MASDSEGAEEPKPRFAHQFVYDPVRDEYYVGNALLRHSLCLLLHFYSYSEAILQMRRSLLGSAISGDSSYIELENTKFYAGANSSFGNVDSTRCASSQTAIQ